MKKVLLSADSKISLFSVPDEVADHLEQYCLEFYTDWLCNSPDAAKYRVKIDDRFLLSFNEKDFIVYLNRRFHGTPSALVETLNDVYVGDKIPEQYIDLPYYNF